MPRKLTPEQCRARAVAYEEAAGHLELNWNDDPVEREQGDYLVKLFYAECEKYRSMAMARELESAPDQGQPTHLGKPRTAVER